MCMRSKLETLEIEIIEEAFTIEKREINLQFKNLKKEIKKEFLSGKELPCIYNNKKVTIQYKDGWFLCK